MELVYSVDPVNGNNRQDSNTKFCFSLSCKNIIAFSRLTGEGTFNKQYEVCVADIDKPWDPYPITKFACPVIGLEWDYTGTRMLIATSNGQCQLFIMTDYLINSWVMFGETDIVAEDIIKMAWLHTGVKLSFNPDKRESLSYSDKFAKTPFAPSLTHFGGKPLDGWIIITSTGLVVIGLIHIPDGKIITVKENLAPCHLRVNFCDISFKSTGQIMVSVSDGVPSSAINIFQVTLTMSHSNCVISSEATPSFFIKGDQDMSNLRILDMQYGSYESSDLLVIAYGKNGESHIEIWHFTEQSFPVHKMFNPTSDSAFHISKWMYKSTVSHNALLTAFCRPRLPLSRMFVENAGFVPYFVVAYRDGMLKVIHRFTYQVIYSTSLDTACLRNLALGTEFLDDRQGSAHLTNISQTFSGCGLFGMQQEKIYLFRMFNIREGPLQLSPPFVILLLEYCVVSGYDWWDIFLSIKQGMIEAICQKLTDNFLKQPASVQDLLHIRLLGLKMALYQSYSSTPGQLKAADSHARLILHAISTELRSILRPRTVSAHDKTPSEKIQTLCSKSTEVDLVQLLTSVEIEEFIVDSRKKDKGLGQSETTLTSLQPLIQWVADFGLHLMASLPLYQTYPNFPGSSLLRDTVILNALRELLIIIRIWGLINSACLPGFTTSSEDVIAQLFKLITKCYLCVKEGGSLELDENLMDECCMLPSRVLIPSLVQSFGSDSTGYQLFTQQHPIPFQMEEDPDFATTKKSTWYMYLPDIPTESKQYHDIVRQMHLGVEPSEPAKECCRCGGISLLRSMAKSSVQKAWEQRWAKACLCSGHWKLYDTMKSN